MVNINENNEILAAERKSMAERLTAASKASAAPNITIEISPKTSFSISAVRPICEQAGFHSWWKTSRSQGISKLQKSTKNIVTESE